uniref:Uncharacterized protein n=1 Tax=Emiliania huxleyi TaxID=2903 RepID=A0A7S3SH93_EMIHU
MSREDTTDACSDAAAAAAAEEARVRPLITALSREDTTDACSDAAAAAAAALRADPFGGRAWAGSNAARNELGRAVRAALKRHDEAAAGEGPTSLAQALAGFRRLSAANSNGALHALPPDVASALRAPHATKEAREEAVRAVRAALEASGFSEADLVTHLQTFSLKNLSEVSGASGASLSSEERYNLLRGCEGAKVCSILEYALPAEVRLLARAGKLRQELSDKVAEACERAGAAACAIAAYNSAGKTPRAEFKKVTRWGSVSRADLVEVLEALLEHQPPQDAGLDAGFTAYAFYSLFSRRSKSDPPTLFEDGFAELKAGDTKWGHRWGNPRVTNQDATAARYTQRMYSRMPSNLAMEARGSRPLRVLSEVLLVWLAEDVATDFGFRTSPPTGEEGLLGPVANAEAALAELAAEVGRCPALRSLFRERWLRTGGHPGQWRRLADSGE